MSFIIPLSKRGKKRGKYETIVDLQDSDLINFDWFILRNRYATRNFFIDDNRYLIHLHRVILSRKLGRELLPTEYVDHIDGDGLNNRRENLRLATGSQNQHNRRKNVDNTSGYKGVYWRKERRKWIAIIQIDGKQVRLGSFDSAKLAHEAYCKKAQEVYGEFANCGE